MGKLKEYLKEERLHSGDKRLILKLIDNKLKGNTTKTSWVLKSFKSGYTDDEREIDIKNLNNGIQLTYNSDHFELTNTLVDICDQSGYEFKTNTERNINTTTFTIILPK